MNSTYIDGIRQIHFINGMVRMDAFVLTHASGGEQKQENAGQIVMTPQGFLSALSAMQQLADRMVQAGVLAKTQ